jgi:hypothetical protein
MLFYRFPSVFHNISHDISLALRHSLASKSLRVDLWIE